LATLKAKNNALRFFGQQQLLFFEPNNALEFWLWRL
jgi:hypothetical protein